MEHTKQPWEISKLASPDYAPQYGIYAEGGRNALCIVKGENAEADAKIIVVAPKLLAVCKKLIGFVEIDNRFVCPATDCQDKDDCGRCVIRHNYDIAIQTIAKAEEE